jgi:hypothetical protein
MIKEWGIIRDRFILPYNEVKEILYLDYVQTGSIPCPPVPHHPGLFHIGFRFHFRYCGFDREPGPVH